MHAISTTTAPARDWSDAELLDQVLSNTQRGWSEFVRRYRALIHKCIGKVVRKHSPHMSMADIEEIYAEVLLSLVRDDARKLRLYDPTRGSKLSSWVGLLTINCAYDHLRGVSRRPLTDQREHTFERLVDSERTPLDSLIEKERWQHLNELLAGFSDKDRRFLHLYYGRGLAARKVAEAMSISLKTVYTKHHKIRAHLRRCVESVAFESPIRDLLPAAA